MKTAVKIGKEINDPNLAIFEEKFSKDTTRIKLNFEKCYKV